jgi:hypothetical protein
MVDNPCQGMNKLSTSIIIVSTVLHVLICVHKCSYVLIVLRFLIVLGVITPIAHAKGEFQSYRSSTKIAVILLLSRDLVT